MKLKFYPRSLYYTSTLFILFIFGYFLLCSKSCSLMRLFDCGRGSYFNLVETKGRKFSEGNVRLNAGLYDFVQSIEIVKVNETIGWVALKNLPDGAESIYYEVYMTSTDGEMLFNWPFVFKMSAENFLVNDLNQFGGDVGDGNLTPFPDLRHVSKGKVGSDDEFYVWIRVFATYNQNSKTHYFVRKILFSQLNVADRADTVSGS